MTTFFLLSPKISRSISWLWVECAYMYCKAKEKRWLRGGTCSWIVVCVGIESILYHCSSTGGVSLVDQTTPSAVLDVLSTRREGLATLAVTQRNAYNWEVHITACSVVTSVADSVLSLLQTGTSCVNHTKIFTPGAFKILIITLAWITLVMFTFQHLS